MNTELQVGTMPCACDREHHETRLIAVTGGPSAGKTAVLQMALRAFCTHVGVLPEAASVVFGGGFPRHDTDVGRRAAQRAIYHIQREVENVVVGEGQIAIGLCDRGTVDGVAYWPGPSASYWNELRTSREAELSRYAAVIHLRTPSPDDYSRENKLRIETPAEAARIDERIYEAWAGHSNRLVVPSSDDFIDKARQALALIRNTLPPCCEAHVLPGLRGHAG